MPRYFFHFVHQDGGVRDSEGTELPDLQRAHAHAELLMEQATGYFDDLSDWRGWLIRITDANDRSRLIVLFPTERSMAALYCDSDPSEGPFERPAERGHERGEREYRQSP